MVSEFRKKKYMHVFSSFFDFDKSGTVDKEDFRQVHYKLAQLRGYKEGEVAANLMKELLTAIWHGLTAQADTDGDGVVNAEEFIKVWDDYAKNPASAPEWQHLYCQAVFQFLDTSNDGGVDADEFAKVNEAFGLDGPKSKEAFAKMAKGKAKITIEDFKILFNEYFSSENPDDAGNFVFGVKPL